VFANKNLLTTTIIGNARMTIKERLVKVLEWAAVRHFEPLIRDIARGPSSAPSVDQVLNDMSRLADTSQRARLLPVCLAKFAFCDATSPHGGGDAVSGVHHNAQQRDDDVRSMDAKRRVELLYETATRQLVQMTLHSFCINSATRFSLADILKLVAWVRDYRCALPTRYPASFGTSLSTLVSVRPFVDDDVLSVVGRPLLPTAHSAFVGNVASKGNKRAIPDSAVMSKSLAKGDDLDTSKPCSSTAVSSSSVVRGIDRGIGSVCHTDSKMSAAQSVPDVVPLATDEEFCAKSIDDLMNIYARGNGHNTMQTVVTNLFDQDVSANANPVEDDNGHIITPTSTDLFSLVHTQLDFILTKTDRRCSSDLCESIEEMLCATIAAYQTRMLDFLRCVEFGSDDDNNSDDKKRKYDDGDNGNSGDAGDNGNKSDTSGKLLLGQDKIPWSEENLCATINTCVRCIDHIEAVQDTLAHSLTRWRSYRTRIRSRCTFVPTLQRESRDGTRRQDQARPIASRPPLPLAAIGPSSNSDSDMDFDSCNANKRKNFGKTRSDASGHKHGLDGKDGQVSKLDAQLDKKCDVDDVHGSDNGNDDDEDEEIGLFERCRSTFTDIAVEAGDLLVVLIAHTMPLGDLFSVAWLNETSKNGVGKHRNVTADIIATMDDFLKDFERWLVRPAHFGRIVKGCARTLCGQYVSLFASAFAKGRLGKAPLKSDTLSRVQADVTDLVAYFGRYAIPRHDTHVRVTRSTFTAESKSKTFVSSSTTSNTSRSASPVRNALSTSNTHAVLPVASIEAETRILYLIEAFATCDDVDFLHVQLDSLRYTFGERAASVLDGLLRTVPNITKAKSSELVALAQQLTVSVPPVAALNSSKPGHVKDKSSR